MEDGTRTPERPLRPVGIQSSPFSPFFKFASELSPISRSKTVHLQTYNELCPKDSPLPPTFTSPRRSSRWARLQSELNAMAVAEKKDPNASIVSPIRFLPAFDLSSAPSESRTSQNVPKEGRHCTNSSPPRLPPKPPPVRDLQLNQTQVEDHPEDPSKPFQTVDSKSDAVAAGSALASKGSRLRTCSNPSSAVDPTNGSEEESLNRHQASAGKMAPPKRRSDSVSVSEDSDSDDPRVEGGDRKDPTADCDSSPNKQREQLLRIRKRVAVSELPSSYGSEDSKPRPKMYRLSITAKDPASAAVVLTKRPRDGGGSSISPSGVPRRARDFLEAPNLGEEWNREGGPGADAGGDAIIPTKRVRSSSQAAAAHSYGDTGTGSLLPHHQHATRHSNKQPVRAGGSSQWRSREQYGSATKDLDARESSLRELKSLLHPSSSKSRRSTLDPNDPIHREAQMEQERKRVLLSGKRRRVSLDGAEIPGRHPSSFSSLARRYLPGVLDGEGHHQSSSSGRPHKHVEHTPLPPGTARKSEDRSSRVDIRNATPSTYDLQKDFEDDDEDEEDEEEEEKDDDDNVDYPGVSRSSPRRQTQKGKKENWNFVRRRCLNFGASSRGRATDYSGQDSPTNSLDGERDFSNSPPAPATGKRVSLDLTSPFGSPNVQSDESPVSEATKKSERRFSHGPSTPNCKRCNCKKSKCLKLYCECFAAGIYCSGCLCINCHNTVENKELVQEMRQQIQSKNPHAFAPKIVARIASPATGVFIVGDSARHKTGCHCKRSFCLKKYCECYQAGVKCTSACKCTDCKNGSCGRDSDHSDEAIDVGGDSSLVSPPGTSRIPSGSKSKNVGVDFKLRRQEISPITPAPSTKVLR